MLQGTSYSAFASGGTGVASNILVDLGSTFLTSSSPVVFNLGDLQTKLVATYGASWFSRGDLFFSVSGSNVSGDPNNTVYVTVANPGAAWDRQAQGTQSSVKLAINGIGGQYNTYTRTVGNPASVEQQSDPNSYGSYMPGGANSPGTASYGVYNPTIEGTPAMTLSLIRLTPGSGPGIDLGDFSLSSAGVLTWTPAAIPEPSTYVSLALGAGLLLLVVRRRSAAKA